MNYIANTVFTFFNRDLRVRPNVQKVCENIQGKWPNAQIVECSEHTSSTSGIKIRERIWESGDSSCRYIYTKEEISSEGISHFIEPMQEANNLMVCLKNGINPDDVRNVLLEALQPSEVNLSLIKSTPYGRSYVIHYEPVTLAVFLKLNTTKLEGVIIEPDSLDAYSFCNTASNNQRSTI